MSKRTAAARRSLAGVRVRTYIRRASPSFTAIVLLPAQPIRSRQFRRYVQCTGSTLAAGGALALASRSTHVARSGVWWRRIATVTPDRWIQGTAACSEQCGHRNPPLAHLISQAQAGIPEQCVLDWLMEASTRTMPWPWLPNSYQTNRPNPSPPGGVVC